MTMVVSAKNGSTVAVSGSGIRHMSDSLIAFHPAIEEPSNIWPSANVSSSIMVTSKVTCCHLPRGSVKRRSTYLTSLSLIALRTSLAVFMFCLSLSSWSFHPPGAVGAGKVGSGEITPHPPRFRRFGCGSLPRYAIQISCHRRFDRAGQTIVGHDDLDLHFRQKIDDIFGAAVEFCVALLPAEPFRLGNGDPLDAGFLQGLLHLVELERLDDRFDLLHCGRSRSDAGPAQNTPTLSFLARRASSSRSIASPPAGAKVAKTVAGERRKVSHLTKA